MSKFVPPKRRQHLSREDRENIEEMLNFYCTFATRP